MNQHFVYDILPPLPTGTKLSRDGRVIGKLLEGVEYTLNGYSAYNLLIGNGDDGGGSTSLQVLSDTGVVRFLPDTDEQSTQDTQLIQKNEQGLLNRLNVWPAPSVASVSWIHGIMRAEIHIRRFRVPFDTNTGELLPLTNIAALSFFALHLFGSVESSLVQIFPLPHPTLLDTFQIWVRLPYDAQILLGVEPQSTANIDGRMAYRLPGTECRAGRVSHLPVRISRIAAGRVATLWVGPHRVATIRAEDIYKYAAGGGRHILATVGMDIAACAIHSDVTHFERIDARWARYDTAPDRRHELPQLSTTTSFTPFGDAASGTSSTDGSSNPGSENVSGRVGDDDTTSAATVSSSVLAIGVAACAVVSTIAP